MSYQPKYTCPACGTKKSVKGYDNRFRGHRGSNGEICPWSGRSLHPVEQTRQRKEWEAKHNKQPAQQSVEPTVSSVVVPLVVVEVHDEDAPF